MPHDAIVETYTRLLDAWNRRDAEAFAGVFAESGRAIGFDGSLMEGRAAIAAELARIFAHHPTAAYVAKVREVTTLGDGAALLHAVVGMVPRGAHEINAATNAIQTLVLAVGDGAPRIVQLQNTPAAYHERQDLREALTRELTEVLRSGAVVGRD